MENTDSAPSTWDSVKSIAMIGVGIIVGLWVVVALIFIAIFGLIKFAVWRSKEGFRIGGFQLGSYDPAMYPSEIVRRP